MFACVPHRADHWPFDATDAEPSRHEDGATKPKTKPSSAAAAPRGLQIPSTRVTPPADRDNGVVWAEATGAVKRLVTDKYHP